MQLSVKAYFQKRKVSCGFSVKTFKEGFPFRHVEEDVRGRTISDTSFPGDIHNTPLRFLLLLLKLLLLKRTRSAWTNNIFSKQRHITIHTHTTSHTSGNALYRRGKVCCRMYMWGCMGVYVNVVACLENCYNYFFLQTLTGFLPMLFRSLQGKEMTRTLKHRFINTDRKHFRCQNNVHAR